MQTKTCTKCGEEKDTTEFYSDKTGKYGVRSDCKDCVKARKKEHYQLPGVKERYREIKRKRYYEEQQIPEIREAERKRKREYQQRSDVKERRREYLKEYQKRPEVKERRLEYDREYKQNPDIRNRLRKRDRENKRKLRAMGLVSSQHISITEKYATLNGERWTDAEVELLMSSDLPLVDIALELGRTYPSVQLKRNRLLRLQADQ